MSEDTISCEHGQLARSCEICELRTRVAVLEEGLALERTSREYWAAEAEAAEAECDRLRAEIPHVGFRVHMKQVEAERDAALADMCLRGKSTSDGPACDIEAELAEQCRLLGASGEREARLRAERDEAQSMVQAYRDDYEAVANEECRGSDPRVHCTCVAPLRKRLEAAEADRDRLAAVVEGVRSLLGVGGEWYDDGGETVIPVRLIQAALAAAPPAATVLSVGPCLSQQRIDGGPWEAQCVECGHPVCEHVRRAALAAAPPAAKCEDGHAVTVMAGCHFCAKSDDGQICDPDKRMRVRICGDFAPVKCETCAWKYDDIDDCWATDCGQFWTYSDGHPDDNGVRYCHHCGRSVLLDGTDGGDDEQSS